MAKCEHNVRETRRGAGACVIGAEVKLRNGRPKWWCRTHGMAAGAPDGSALEQCPGAWFDPVPEDQRLDLDAGSGQIAIWGAIAPAIELGSPPDEPGKVHVHRRPAPGQEKDIDRSFDIVEVRNGERRLVIEGMAAVAFSISELSGRAVTPLTCSWCGEVHIDEQKFATRPHSKHQCNACGRNFNDSQPSISNPLADAEQQLGLPAPPAPVAIDRPLDLVSADYGAITLFPTNRAILSTMDRAEETGVHVHAWNFDKELILDETYFPVTLDGVAIDPHLLRSLAVQRALAHGAPIEYRECANCHAPLLSPRDGWLEPVTSHTCANCGAALRTRLKSFLNPLAGVER